MVKEVQSLQEHIQISVVHIIIGKNLISRFNIIRSNLFIFYNNRCLDLQKSLDGENKKDISDTYLNIGIAYDDFGQPDKALENYTE